MLSMFRAVVGGIVGVVGGTVVGSLIAGLCALFDPNTFDRIGLLSFLAIFASAGALSGAIQWWRNDD